MTDRSRPRGAADAPDHGAAHHPTGAEPVIEATGLGRSFGAQTVFADVTFAVHAGEIHAVIGANGAGKSTLLRILAGVMAPSTGRARVGGHDPAERGARALVGWLPSTDRSFYLRLTGRENLLFFGRMHGMTRTAAQQRADELLDTLDLASAARKRAGLYSRGMLRRLSIARALLASPPVLLLDEPTHDLDPAGIAVVTAVVRASGAAVVWATQQLDELDGFADRVVVLANGKARYNGPLDALTARSRSARHILRLHGADRERLDERTLRDRFGSGVSFEHRGGERVVVDLPHDHTIGALIAALETAGVRVVSSRPEQGEVEQALLRLIEAVRDE